MRVAASTSSPLVSPTSGLSTAPAKWPSRVSRSRPTTRAYSWARCSGLRVWKATTRCNPFLAKSARVSRGVSTTSPYSGCFGWRQHLNLAADEMLARIVEHHAGAGMVGALRAVDRFEVALLLERVDVDDVEHADGFAGLIDERRLSSRLQGFRFGAGSREALRGSSKRTPCRRGR